MARDASTRGRPAGNDRCANRGADRTSRSADTDLEKSQGRKGPASVITAHQELFFLIRRKTPFPGTWHVPEATQRKRSALHLRCYLRVKLTVLHVELAPDVGTALRVASRPVVCRPNVAGQVCVGLKSTTSRSPIVSAPPGPGSHCLTYLHWP